MGDRRTSAAFRDAQTLAKPLALCARGETQLAFRPLAGRTRVAKAYQDGCLRVRFPNTAGQALEAVVINTGGGVTGGDVLTQSIRWEAGADASVTTPAAEKVYRAASGQARVETRLTVGAGARAEWLPQETILFDGAALRRTLNVEMEASSTFLGVECVVFGRAAMGEVVRRGSLQDRWSIRRAGRLVFADAQSLGGRIDGLMDRAAIGGGARAMALAVYAAPDTASILEPVRASLEEAASRGAASERDGVLVLRLLGPDGRTVREDLVRTLGVLRGARALPRMWNC